MTQSSPQYVGHGTYGCVLSPAVACQHKHKGHDQHHYNNKSVVAKLYKDRNQGVSEVDIYNEIVKEVDPQSRFTVRLVDHCYIKPTLYKQLYKCNNWTPSERRQSLVKQLIYEDGGVDLVSAVKSCMFEDIFKSMKRLFEALIIMDSKRIAHLDIKPNNIVYNAKTKKMSLIDFGLAHSYDDVYSAQYIISFLYRYYPPEFRVAAEAEQKDTITIPSQRYSHHYANWYNAVNTISHVHVPSGLLNMWLHVVDRNRGFNSFKTFLESQSSPDMHTLPLIQKMARYTNKVDVYMLGITLLETLANCIQSRTASLNDHLQFYQAVLQLIERMTRMNPNERYTPQQARVHYKRVFSLISSVPLSPSPNLQASSVRATKVKRKDRKPLPRSIQDDCEAFRADQNINPQTKRRIKKGGPTHKKLIKKCAETSSASPLHVSNEDCIAFRNDQSKNPLTKRRIKINGPTYRSLQLACADR